MISNTSRRFIWLFIPWWHTFQYQMITAFKADLHGILMTVKIVSILMQIGSPDINLFDCTVHIVMYKIQIIFNAEHIQIGRVQLNTYAFSW